LSFKKGTAIKVVDRTNPRRKWDWYQLGGRWTGFFKLKKGVMLFNTGKPGLMTDQAREGWADQAFKEDIDFEGMAEEASRKFGEFWDKVHAVLDQHDPIVPWNEMIKRAGMDPDALDSEELSNRLDEVRRAYRSQKGLNALRKAKLDVWNIDSLLVPRDEYCRSGVINSCRTFAVVKNGEWYEKGEMGWWGCVSNEDKKWGEKYYELLRSIPNGTLLSVYDCHI